MMLAYKGFTKELTATMGKGVFRFETGKTYEEKECKCAHNGFHCAEDPLGVLRYYSGMDTRFFLVRAEGEVNQDGEGSRISCTRLTLVKEISRTGLAVHACRYMERYPERKPDGDYVKRERGTCTRKDDFIIVRGKDPRGSGVKGSWFFLVREEAGSPRIRTVYPVYVDGEEIREKTYYGLRGDGLCRRKN